MGHISILKFNAYHLLTKAGPTVMYNVCPFHLRRLEFRSSQLFTVHHPFNNLI